MKKNTYIFICFLLFTFSIALIVCWLNKIYLPADILKSLPIFGLVPTGIKNSLLADSVFQFEPWRIFLKESIFHGIFPFWNDLNGSGVPFAANPITAVFAPLNFIYFLFDPKISLLLIAFLKTFLFSFGTFLYLRQVKITRALAFIGGIAVLSGYFLLWLNWPQVSVYLFFPYILLILERGSEEINYVKFVLLSIVFFLAFISGHPETYFQIALVGFLYLVLKFGFKKKLVLFYCGAIFVGTLMGAFQLLPFLEYLHYSWAFKIRSGGVSSLLPLKSLIFFFAPYILGAPHLGQYKPLNGTNFQEASGGYVGLPLLVLIAINIKSLFKSNLNRTWFFILFISIMMAFAFPLLSSIINNSPLGINTNSRLVGTSGFAIVVLGISIINSILKRKIKLKFKNNILLFLGLLIVVGLFLTLFSLHMFGHLFLPTKQIQFLFLFTVLICVSLLATVSLFLLLNNTKSISSIKSNLLLFLLIVIPSVGLFITYNPLVDSIDYYPSNQIIQYLKNSNGRILNVGNTNLSADINMAYGIKSVENYDAMDVLSYRKAFDKYFPDKNYLGNVDSVTNLGLKEFGIKTVISDYDINLVKINQYHESKNVIPLEKEISVPIIGNGRILNQIRFIPATYNRINNCKLDVILMHEHTTIDSNELSCNSFYNNMFETVDIKPILLLKNEKYSLQFRTNKTNNLDNIALFGGEKPYLDLLFGINTNIYRKIFERGNVVVYDVSNSQIIDSDSSYKIIEQNTNQLTFLTNSKKPTSMNIKMTYYPGWEVYINGKKGTINGRNPFMKIFLPKGMSIVKLEYIPISFYAGLALSVLTFMTLIIFGMINLRKIKQ